MARLTKKLKKHGVTKAMLARAKREGGITLPNSSSKQTGSSEKRSDRKVAALTPGKRLSRNGNIYYESRKNRSDKSRKKRV